MFQEANAGEDPVDRGSVAMRDELLATSNLFLCIFPMSLWGINLQGSVADDVEVVQSWTLIRDTKRWERALDPYPLYISNYKLPCLLLLGPNSSAR